MWLERKEAGYGDGEGMECRRETDSGTGWAKIKGKPVKEICREDSIRDV